MYGTDQISDDAERTAFRRAEKKYKLYYDDTSKSSKKKKQPKQVDLSEVLDSSALSIEEQYQWMRESLTSFPQPPNRTNHNAIYGYIHDLFDAVKEKKILVEESSPASSDLGANSCVSNGDAHRWKFYEESIADLRGKTCKSFTASVLLRKLRWSTLGLQFEWSKRNYDVSLQHNKIPDALCQLAKRLAAPAMPIGQEFQPEAAIVNYFGLGDALGGHLDDMEADWSKPIVSMSLGCKAIFLLGGKSREDPPLAMFLRSGDAVLMAGEARECFLGVPRIFTDKENAEISHLDSQFSHEDDHFFLRIYQNFKNQHQHQTSFLSVSFISV